MAKKLDVVEFGKLLNQSVASVTIKNMVSREIENAIIHNVVESCFGEGYTYFPENREIAMIANMLEHYCNTTYKNNEDLIDFAYNEKLVELMRSQIKYGQLDHMRKSINESIEFKKNCILKMMNSVTDEVMYNINDLIYNLNAALINTTDAMDGLDVGKLNEIVGKISPMLEGK